MTRVHAAPYGAGRNRHAKEPHAARLGRNSARGPRQVTHHFRRARDQYPENDWLRSLPASVLYGIAVAGGAIVIGLSILVLTLTFAAAVRL